MSEDDRSEIDVLFPEVDVDGVKVRPWSLGRLVDLSRHLRSIKADVIGENLKLDELTVVRDGRVFPTERMFDFLSLLLPVSPEIISTTTGLSLSDVRSWPTERAMSILLVIVTQNIVSIKNFCGLGMSVREDQPVVDPVT